jgi:hypothetical protein
VIAEVGIQALFDGAGGDMQRLAARRDLDGLEIEAVGGAAAYEGFDLRDDVLVERRLEVFRGAPFLTASSEVALAASSSTSHSCSLVSMNARTKPRKRRYSTS